MRLVKPGARLAYSIIVIGLTLVLIGSIIAIYMFLTYKADFNIMKPGLEGGLVYSLAVLEYVAVEIAYVGIPVYAGIKLVQYGLEHYRKLPEASRSG